MIPHPPSPQPHAHTRTKAPVRALQEAGDVRDDDTLPAPAHAAHGLVPQAVPVADAWGVE